MRKSWFYDVKEKIVPRVFSRIENENGNQPFVSFKISTALDFNFENFSRNYLSNMFLIQFLFSKTMRSKKCFWEWIPKERKKQKQQKKIQNSEKGIKHRNLL